VKKKTLITAGLILAAALSLTVSAVNADKEDKGQNSQTLKVVSKATAINRLALSSPPQTGDRWTFRDDLFSASDQTKKVGKADGECVLIDPATFQFECTITNSFADGDVMTHGSLRAATGGTSTGAIIGGTKRYQNARGEATIKFGPFGGPHEATFTINLRP
jgi:hypothetical protein